MNSIAEKYIRKETLPFIFCPGCGHGIVVNAFLRVLDKLNIGENEMGLVSGIGCSSWAPVYIDMDCLHTLHGRALAQAEGMKAVNPDKKVVVFSGDGDCAGIGGNHLIHAAKRNVDITVIMMSNYIYGMTGAGRNIFSFKTPTEMYDWYEQQVAVLKPGQTEAPDGKIGLGILYVDETKEELCDVQAEKKEEAKK